MKGNFNILLEKFIDNTISAEEYELFMDLIKSPENRDSFEKVIGNFPKSPRSLEKRSNNDSEMLFDRIWDQIDDAKTKPFLSLEKTNFSKLYKIAAVLLVLLGLTFGYNKVFIGEKQVPTNPNHITLTFGNGQTQILSEKGQHKILDSKGKLVGIQNGSHLNYGHGPVPDELIFNELTVPNGKRFDVSLSDGTYVKLNSGSSIKYPVHFIKGMERKIFLKGEAYFDVASDKEHPFIVNANSVNVQVLGTKFNVSHYPTDEDINTVLIEGSVKLYENGDKDNTGKQVLLVPGQLANWDKETKEISVKRVDPKDYTAWKDGILLFRNIPFSTIRKRLERHFNVSIENNYSFLDKQIYSASFTNQKNLGEILDSFSEDTPFSYEYSKEDNKIIITNILN